MSYFCARDRFQKAGYLGYIALLLAAAGCTEKNVVNTRAAESEIRAADAQWAKTAQAHDVDGTVAYYAEGAVLLPPNAPIAADKKAIRDSWAALLGPVTSISWQPTKIEVAQSGDLAYLVGTYSITLNDAHGNPVTDRGKMIEVWKKQADGHWKAIADTYNSDFPAPSA